MCNVCWNRSSWQRKRIFTFQCRLQFPCSQSETCQWGSGRKLPLWMTGLAAKGHSLLEETISFLASIKRGKFLSPLVKSVFSTAVLWRKMAPHLQMTPRLNVFFISPIHQLFNGLWNCLEPCFPVRTCCAADRCCQTFQPVYILS